jgi:hypothetical protein
MPRRAPNIGYGRSPAVTHPAPMGAPSGMEAFPKLVMPDPEVLPFN